MTTTPSADRRDAVVEQIFRGTIQALEILHVYVGDRLGLYAALSMVPDTSPGELARRTGIADRYAREWLEQQAVCGLLDVVDKNGVVNENGGAHDRRYRLPPEVAEVMTDPDSLNFLAPLASMVAGIGTAMPAVLEAFRTGGGVPYEAYGEDLRSGIARLNRPMFLHQLAQDWIPAVPDVEARLLRSEPPGRVADLGCGTGWSSIAMAQAYPMASVDGVDADSASITEARRNAENAGVSDRVRFHLSDAGRVSLPGSYDLITFFETLHDMANPVEALRAAAEALAPGGVVLVADERVAETFAAPGDDLERFNYGWSALHCLPSSMTVAGSAATGTVMRPGTLQRYAREAGFAAVSVLPIEQDFWRFYRIDP